MVGLDGLDLKLAAMLESELRQEDLCLPFLVRQVSDCVKNLLSVSL